MALADPLIGSGGFGFAVGSGVPGAQRPMGLVSISPDTADEIGSYAGFHRGGGYHADDVWLRAISHTHLHGPGLTDYGHVGVSPVDGMWDPASGAARDTPESRWGAMDKATEVASAGAYAIRLSSPPMGIALSASQHTGLSRFEFEPSVATPTLAFDLGHRNGDGVTLDAGIEVDPGNGRVRGWMLTEGEMSGPMTVWFEAESSEPPASWGTFGDLEAPDLQRGTTVAAGPAAGAWLSFSHHDVALRVAVSLVDAAGAANNLAAEAYGFDGELDRQVSSWDWARHLAPLRAWGGSERDQIMLASGLYHSLLMPHDEADVDGRYMGFDGQIHEGASAYLSDLSLWDTYRTTHPLYTLLWPEHQRDILNSLARMAEQGGSLPRWPMLVSDGGFMVGMPASVVIGEAWQKGITDIDVEPLLEAAVAVATGELVPDYGSVPDIQTLETYNYYPADLVGSSVAWQEELALADYAMAPMVSALHDPQVGAHLAERATWWRNLWDPEISFFHARNSDGSFSPLESETAWADEFREGNATQYRWLVPHDPEGLFSLMGGDPIAVDLLEQLFEDTLDNEGEGLTGTPKPYFWAGNEHDMQIPFLPALAGDHALTERWVDWTLAEEYGTGPDGLPGNDDGGAMSAWVVWAEIGLYPLAGTDRYVLGAPHFDRVEIDLEGGTLVLLREGEGAVSEVLLDGEPVDGWSIRHADLLGGRTLCFVGAGATP